MTTQQTLQKMLDMKLHGMARAFKTTMEPPFSQNFTSDELIAHLIDAEWEERYNRKLARLLKLANFRYQMSFEQIDFTHKRNLDKNMLLRLSSCDWIAKSENVLITGPTGAGKSSISCALGHQACLNGYHALYFRAMKLFSKFKLAKADGSYARELSKIANQNVLIIDDFGLHPIDQETKLILLELLEERYSCRSTIVTSQLPVSEWHNFIDDATIADAILDRLIHNSHRIELDGDSMRKIKAKHSR